MDSLTQHGFKSRTTKHKLTLGLTSLTIKTTQLEKVCNSCLRSKMITEFKKLDDIDCKECILVGNFLI